MPERDVHALRAEALAALAAATQAANGAPDVESALGHLMAATQGVLGDKEAPLRPGRLRAGEHQFVVSGIFLMTPNRQHNLLVAEHGFPPEQHRLRIPLDLGHPGRVAQLQCPLVLTNTDEAVDFRQILKTSHRARRCSGRWSGGVRCSAKSSPQRRPGTPMALSTSTSSWASRMWLLPSTSHTADPRGYGPACDNACREAVRNVYPAARNVSAVISGGIPRRRGSPSVPSPGLTYRKADFRGRAAVSSRAGCAVGPNGRR